MMNVIENFSWFAQGTWNQNQRESHCCHAYPTFKLHPSCNLTLVLQRIPQPYSKNITVDVFFFFPGAEDSFYFYSRWTYKAKVFVVYMTCYLYNYYSLGPRTVPVSCYMRSTKLNKLPCSKVFPCSTLTWSS